MFASNTSQVSSAANYIEDVFNTYLYAGNGSTQTINNGIDLAGKGGLVWTKRRNAAGYGNYFIDTLRGATKVIDSTSTASETTYADSLTAFTATGYTLGADTLNGGFNNGAGTYVGWTFRKQPKFFDEVTYTGTGSATTIAHNLGSAPRFMIVKRTDTTGNWCVYHSDLGATQIMLLNTTAAAATGTTYWNSTNPTSTVFSVGTNAAVNASGGTYVAYLFASDAGGFGLTGTDNVISCGSYTGNSTSGVAISLGYEPQWVMIKRTDSTGNWTMIDAMRGFPVGSNDAAFWANTTNAELSGQAGNPTATGFYLDGSWSDVNAPGGTYIYIAIRRGPMKTPTSGTSVFSPIVSSATTGTTLTTNFPIDLQMAAARSGASSNTTFSTRLIGVNSTSTSALNNYLVSSSAGAEVATGLTLLWDNTGFQMPSYYSGVSDVFWSFRRAPGFFDEVCYTGNDVSRNLTHNLGVAPQLWIVKARSTTADWSVGSSLLASTTNDYLLMNLTDAKASLANFWNTPTSTTFGFGSGLPSAANINAASQTYVAHLFASCPGVSKVGSYTGTGAAQTINCGFAAGARFVLIKRTDSTGGWYVWDTARGIISGNDPYLLLNSTSNEVANTDYISPQSSGFGLTASAPAALNASGGTYIYLAIA